MYSVEVGLLALRYAMQWDSPRPMKIYFDERLCIEGNSNGFLNPAVEAAIIHSRALLEFLGFRCNSTSKLGSRQSARVSDVIIERFSNKRGPLSKVHLCEVVRFYPGSAVEAEHALAYVMHTANKGLAHSTDNFHNHSESSRFLDIAFRGVNTLMVNCFYNRMGIKPPEYQLRSRHREA